ncbi:MAG: tyrosine-type recombinase/integrase, partial [Actinomycetota bacterium]
GTNKGRTPANKGVRYPAEVLTPDEVRRLIAACSETSSLGLRHRALITVMYRAGLRCSEALALRTKDLDLQAGSLAVLHGKGDRRRTVGIDRGAIQIVEAWVERRTELGLPTDAPLFCTLRGTPIPPSQIRTLLPRLAAKAGISKRVHPHGLRHTHAYELMMEGVEMPIIQAQLGHLSLATTNTYLAHIAPKEVIETIHKRRWYLY